MTYTEIVFKIIEMSISFIGLILVVFGLIIPYQHSKKANQMLINNEKEQEKIRWEKELVDIQIAQLYGPIYALILETNAQFDRILYQLGRKAVFKEGETLSDLPIDEQKVWKHYVDTYKVHKQVQIVEIFRNNIHLVYKSEIPTCYKVFLDYALGWEMLDSQNKNGVPNFYGYHYLHNYPHEFNTYIVSTFKLLQKEQSRLLSLDKKRYQSTSY